MSIRFQTTRYLLESDLISSHLISAVYSFRCFCFVMTSQTVASSFLSDGLPGAAVAGLLVQQGGMFEHRGVPWSELPARVF